MSAEDPTEMDAAMESDDESNDEEDEDSEAQDLAKLMELEAVLKSDPYHYQSHIDKIAVLKKLGELEQLTAARESFAKLYPLSPELWLEWLRDEQGLTSNEEEKAKLFALFETAVKDYVSVDIWLEFCQFSLGGLTTSEGVFRARDVFEKAITAVGIHVSKGALIWEAYREFEGALLALMAADSYSDENRAEQKSRIDKIFRRQLTVPLLDMESTWLEYLSWLAPLVPDSGVESSFQAARKLLAEREERENSLLKTSGEEQLKVYGEYLEFESKAGLPVRIQSLNERRITDHCLVPFVWAEFLDYLDVTLKIDSISVSTHERSIRNCPWNGDLWVTYIRALERYKQPRKDVVRVFEQAISAGIANPAEYLNLWLTFIDYTRRYLKNEEGEKDKLKVEEEIRAMFAKAVNHLAQMGGDPECKVARYWAWVEGDLLASMEEARRIWSDILASIGDGARFWIEYVQLEKLCGDTKHLKKLYPRALERCRDFPELIGESWVQFEREEGTLESFEEAERKFKKKMERTLEVRAREAAALEEEEKRKAGKIEKRKDRDKDKRREKRHFESDQKRADRKRKMDGNYEDSAQRSNSKSFKPEVFKIPNLPGATKVAPPPGYKGDAPGQRTSVAPPPGFAGSNDASKETRTVFVSNLDYSAEEEDIKAALLSSGDIVEVRLVKNPSGKSKGFAFVEFGSRSSAENALGRDHEQLKGRPMFISECDAEKKAKGHQFKYGVGLEKNKLFVKGLPVTSTKEDLEKMFGEFGKVKDIRIVTYRNGHSKGIAFVEFEDDSSAGHAILKMDGMKLEGNELSVAISNPPERREVKMGEPASLGGGTRASKAEGRPRAQVAFVPRALIKAKDSANNANEGSVDGVKKSNADFRNMLLGKK